MPCPERQRAARPRPEVPRRSLLRSSSAALILAACAGGHPADNPNASPNSPVELRAAEGKPRYSLAARTGDPFAAVSVSVAHDLGAVASIWLAAMLESRHPAKNGDASRPIVSGNGFVLRTKVRSPEEAAGYVEATRRAFDAPITDDEFVRIRDTVRKAPPVRSWTSASEAAVADCIGEPGERAGSSPTRAVVEEWRSRIFSVENVAFSAVGPRAVLDAVEASIRRSPPWPKGARAADPWPTADVVGLSTNGDRARTLSVALRTPEIAKALEAAKALGRPDSALVKHAAALETAWNIERVVGTVRVRGACLRVDLRSDANAPVPTPAAAADVAAMALDEALRALSEAPGAPGSLDAGVLESFDPRDAAAVAAWRALGGRLPPGPTRSFVSYGLGGSTHESSGDASFAKALDGALAMRKRPTVDEKRAAEAGQGETWLLLGSPCATLTESAEDAGASALVVKSIAQSTSDTNGVRIEAWLSGDGVGLLAHGGRLSPEEPPSRQSERIAEALGRALAGARIDATAAAAARTDLESELNPETQPLWFAALGILAPARTSSLDPRGTWQSVTNVSIHSIEARRLAFIRGPLRLAILSNGPALDSTAESGLERWLQPDRRGQTRCPAAPPLGTRAGEYVVDTASGVQASRALVAVPIPPSATGGLPAEAEWTLHLLNRHGGWLDRSVRLPGVASAAEAALVGGSNGGALIVEVAAPAGQTREAVAQIRALFGRLAEGAATPDDTEGAKAESIEAQAAAATDPRHRLIALWLGRSATAAPDIASLRAFHRRIFASERHVVVTGKARP